MKLLNINKILVGKDLTKRTIKSILLHTKFFGFIGLIIILNSCNIKLTDFNPSGAVKIVISGMISDSTGNHRIYISSSKNVIATGFPDPISNATVIVKDNISLVDTFRYVPNVQIPISSYYKPSKQWAAVKGRTYTMTVISDGTTYTANETMPNLPGYQIDSLQVLYRYQAVATKGADTVSVLSYNQAGFLYDYIHVNDSLFRVKLFAPNKQFGRVNTKLSVYREVNGLTIPYNSGSVYVFNSLLSQTLTNLYVLPGLNGPSTSLYFKSGDKCIVALEAISDNAYSYFDGVNAVNSSDGGIFSAPAGNPPSNISGGALGYFYAAQLVTKTVDIKFIPGVTQTDNTGR